MIDPIKLEIVENEIKTYFPIPDMYNKILGLYGNLMEGSVCCPFHSEEEPSFSYSPHYEIWTCFGSCSRSGDTIELYRFYQKVHKGKSLSRANTVKALMNIPEIKAKLSIHSIDMETNNPTDFRKFLDRRLTARVKPLNKDKAKLVKAVGAVKQSRSEEEFILRYNDLLKVRLTEEGS